METNIQNMQNNVSNTIHAWSMYYKFIINGCLGIQKPP
jgi:hypothetical protein